MRHSHLFTGLLLFALLVPLSGHATVKNPQVITDLLERIGGTGASGLFVTLLDSSLTAQNHETFVITSDEGKPCIKGSTPLAIATGINWYLNHTAHINLTWNRLTADFSSLQLPLPAAEETHTANADYRYDLNYCTFSYSMSTWTWERWQKEIDWMALHGINMPLQIIGTDVVWLNTLEELGYTEAEADKFIAGPCFQAWWLMSNLEGWGGDNPSWWYTRQEALCKKIMSLERAYGMQPVLPGYAGIVPSTLGTKKTEWSASIIQGGGWCGFTRPALLNPTSTYFTQMAEIYYRNLAKVMGTSEFYSIDCFHEGSVPSSLNTSALKTAVFNAVFQAMDTNIGTNAKWIIQNWGNNPLSECLSTVPKGRLVVLDLFADGRPHWKSSKSFSGHDMIYCMLHNFGGRIGLHGRLATTAQGYYDDLAAYPATLKGVGATPEGIETNPILYDMLFELPWRTSFSTSSWLRQYAQARYGVTDVDSHLYPAWEDLTGSILNCPTDQSGTTEPVICARPSMVVNNVSGWGTCTIYWNPEKVRFAANHMLEGSTTAISQTDNYRYDLVDITRQTVTDYANTLLKQMNTALTAGQKTNFSTLKNRFLGLILDQDELLNTCPDFMLGRWTETAKAIADEPEAAAAGAGATAKYWLEKNARQLITVWGPENASNGSGLHDYSNREWGGLLKDFHYARWKEFLDDKEKGTTVPTGSAWYAKENAWATSHATSYPTTAQGDAYATATKMFAKYFGKLYVKDNLSALFAFMTTETRDTVLARLPIGQAAEMKATVPSADAVADIYVDYNNDGNLAENEKTTATGSDLQRTFSITAPATATTGTVKAKLVITDASGIATELSFSVQLRDAITTPRTVSVDVNNPNAGTAGIEGAQTTQVTNTDEVTVNATPKSGYMFLYWTTASGAIVSYSSSYLYMGKEAISLTANFTADKWGAVKEDFTDANDIKSYKQWVAHLEWTQSGTDGKTLYESANYPGKLFIVIPTVLRVARGSHLKLTWNDAGGGLAYCRLSAYIDLNADGDFADTGELLQVRGAKSSSGNTTVSSGSLTVKLPADMALGVTRLRLRFDGAWSGGWDATTDAAALAATQNSRLHRLWFQ
jgi:alpha-N-acetylglucosaminidase